MFYFSLFRFSTQRASISPSPLLHHTYWVAFSSSSLPSHTEQPPLLPHGTCVAAARSGLSCAIPDVCARRRWHRSIQKTDYSAVVRIAGISFQTFQRERRAEGANFGESRTSESNLRVEPQSRTSESRCSHFTSPQRASRRGRVLRAGLLGCAAPRPNAAAPLVPARVVQPPAQPQPPQPQQPQPPPLPRPQPHPQPPGGRSRRSLRRSRLHHCHLCNSRRWWGCGCSSRRRCRWLRRGCGWRWRRRERLGRWRRSLAPTITPILVILLLFS